jgi:hypothetical protein
MAGETIPQHLITWPTAANRRRQEKSLQNFSKIEPRTYSEDPRRSQPVSITWETGNLIGRIVIDGQQWASVEWSDHHQCWCIEDSQGACLQHVASIHGAAASKDEAAAMATDMIRDRRLPSPEEATWRRLPERMRGPSFEAYLAEEQRKREQREKRNRQPAVIRRKEERKRLDEEWSASMRTEWNARQRDQKEAPLYEVLADVFDFADPELWKSNSFAALRPRLIIHLERQIAELDSNRAYHAQRAQRDKGRRQVIERYETRIAKAREILELLVRD